MITRKELTPRAHEGKTSARAGSQTEVPPSRIASTRARFSRQL